MHQRTDLELVPGLAEHQTFKSWEAQEKNRIETLEKIMPDIERNLKAARESKRDAMFRIVG